MTVVLINTPFLRHFIARIEESLQAYRAEDHGILYVYCGYMDFMAT